MYGLLFLCFYPFQLSILLGITFLLFLLLFFFTKFRNKWMSLESLFCIGILHMFRSSNKLFCSNFCIFYFIYNPQLYKCIFLLSHFSSSIIIVMQIQFYNLICYNFLDINLYLTGYQLLSNSLYIEQLSHCGTLNTGQMENIVKYFFSGINEWHVL